MLPRCQALPCNGFLPPDDACQASYVLPLRISTTVSHVALSLNPHNLQQDFQLGEISGLACQYDWSAQTLPKEEMISRMPNCRPPLDIMVM